MSDFFHSSLYQLLSACYGETTARDIARGFSMPRCVTMRVNTLKSNVEYVKSRLDEVGIGYIGVPWYGDALVMPKAREDDIRALDIYADGKIYLQNLSSMIPPLLLEAGEGDCVLDMTAAPGGKCAQIAALTANKAQLTACEKDKIRTERLKYNIARQGVRAYVMNADATKLSDMFSFDKILLDAPCSGSGTVRISDRGVSGAFSDKLLRNSVRLQKALLTKALTLLKRGGRLVYSTCSVLADENCGVLSAVLPRFDADVAPVPKDRFEGVPLLPTEIDGAITVCPDGLYEGFFAAVIVKR